MSETNKLKASVRTEFGKGAARRTRSAGLVPAVLYGRGTEPRHLTVASLEFAAILRNNGTNAVLSLDIDGEDQLALTKQVVVHPLRNYIEHADLLVIKRGEKVTVTVPVLVEGEAGPGTQIQQDLNEVEVEADVLSIPESLTVSVEGLEIGSQILVSQLTVPAGVEVLSDPEGLIVNITEVFDAEAELDAEAEAAAEAAGETDGDAEGDTAADESDSDGDKASE